MTDAFDHLEAQIVAALPAYAAPAQRSARRFRAPRRLVALVVVAIAGGSAVAVAQLTDQGTVVAPRSENLDLTRSFSVFRRPATDRDALRTKTGAVDPSVNGETRLALTDGDRQLYVNNAGDGRLCLYLQTSALATHTCTAQDQAVAGALPPSLTLLDADGSSTYLLLPDGVPAVTATTTAGRTSTVPVTENAVALPRDTDRVVWATPDGEQHQLDDVAPPMPKLARP